VKAENEQDEDTQRREKQVPRAPHDLAAGGRSRSASVCGRHSRDRAGGGAAASGRLGFVLRPSPVRSSKSWRVGDGGPAGRRSPRRQAPPASRVICSGKLRLYRRSSRGMPVSRLRIASKWTAAKSAPR